MLYNTLCHIPRISLNKEKELWDKGIHGWKEYQPLSKDPSFIDECNNHLKKKNPLFFAQYLKTDQIWRLFNDFRDEVIYLDIETTGLEKSFDQITTIATYDGKDIKTYINGKNIHAFKDDIKKHKIIVTYNGKCFDVPFINSYFNINLPQVHIDLRYIFSKLGFSGGLKIIERKLKINRGDIAEVDGFMAIKLWNEYKRNKNNLALETLLAYNCHDAVNLEKLMIHAYNLNIKNTPFYKNKFIEERPSPIIPFNIDKKTIKKFSF